MMHKGNIQFPTHMVCTEVTFLHKVGLVELNQLQLVVAFVAYQS